MTFSYMKLHESDLISVSVLIIISGENLNVCFLSDCNSEIKRKKKHV